MKNKTKILIVGGTGFIGYHLAKKLIEKNFNISSISTKFPKKNRRLNGVKYLIIDISKIEILKKTIGKNKFDYVINLGGYVDHSNRKKTFYSHYNGCKNLSDLFLNKGIKKFIQIGSSVEYGRIKSPQQEKSFIKAKSVKSTYGLSKLKASNYLMYLYKKFKFPAVILRLYLIYGPNQEINRFLPIIITNCIKNKTFPCSEGRQFRDFLYIDDLVNAIEKFLNSKKNLNGKIFNIGSGKPINIKYIIKTIQKIINGGEPLYGKIKLRKDEIIHLYPSIKKIKKYTKWKPKISFEQGLKKTILSYEKNYK